MDDDSLFGSDTHWNDSLETQFELFKEFYYRELERRDRLEAGLAIPTTVIIVLVGGLGIFVDKASEIGDPILEVILLIPSLGVATCVIIAVINLYKAVSPGEYRYLPDPDDYLEIAGDVGDELLSKGEENVTERVVNALKHYLYDQYREIAKYNAEINRFVSHKIWSNIDIA